MRYKSVMLLLILLTLIVVISSLFLFIKPPKKEMHVKLKTSLVKELERQKHESANVLKKSWGDKTLFKPINAVQGSKDEYITYYAYQTASILGQSPGKNYCKFMKHVTDQNSFSTETENLIFTGIERVYRAQKSLELCMGETEQTNLSTIEKHVKYLLNSTYIDEGYFISEEFKTHKDKPEYTEVKFQQTYMMLYLANVYNQLDELNIEQIKSWIKQISLNDLMMINTLTNINDILGSKTNIKIDLNEVQNLINKAEYHFSDFISLNSLVQLSKKKYIQLDNSMTNTIIEKTKKYKFGLSDIQSEYFKNNILKTLNSFMNEKEKENLLQDFSTYMYDDGMLPTFSTYNNPFSPSLIGRLSEEFTVEHPGIHDAIILNKIRTVNIAELMKEDSFEVYSYSTLFKLTNSDPNKLQKEELKKMLLQKIKQPISHGNIMSWSFYVKSLINLEGKISSKVLPDNTNEILNNIIKTEKSYFGENNEISTLVFLETLASTKLYQDKIVKTKAFIDKVYCDENSEIGAYLIYYKTMLQEELEIPYDKNEIASKLALLFNRSGYSLSTKHEFPDIYSTYFLIKINHKLTEGQNHA
ncbi:hypothetical protein ACQKFK_29590 [Bacillus mycoides]|uniref:hypothetical protein n=1 Tax=Bacillus mycoides TaxID=1405 RepID=UPI003D012399